MATKKINYEFRERLNRILGGFSHNYCYQCGACVADCPTHRFLPEFNPRTIILKAIYGLEEELIGPDSLIWNCTNCYNCYERCPQEVHPIEVIIALKNMSRQMSQHKPNVDNILNRVADKGFTVVQTELVNRRRNELHLPAFEPDCIEEVNKLFARDQKEKSKSGEKK
jgi:heterodisulfide reductase subunit C